MAVLSDDPGARPDVQAAPGADLAPVLVPFRFWLTPPSAAALDRPWPSVRHLQEAMAAHFARLALPGAEPLRWAITAVEPNRGLCLEGVALVSATSPVAQGRPQAGGPWQP